MAESGSPRGKKGMLIGRPGQPLEFHDVEDTDLSEIDGLSLPTATAKTLSAYLEASQTLLEGKFASQKALAPPHMRLPCTILVIGCNDGILVRYDKRLEEETPKVRWTAVDQSLTEMAPMLSEQVVHFPDDPSTYSLSENGPAIVLSTKDPTGEVQEKSRFYPKVFATRTSLDDSEIPPPPARPPFLLSIHNEFDMQMAGFIEPVNEPAKSVEQGVEQFILHGRFRLPVGWEAIEFYPLLSDDYWKVDYAPLWAETDLLAAIAHKNLIGSTLSGLDNRGASRKLYAALLDEFETLLAGPEEPVHQFLKQHPVLLCPTSDCYWSKLAFGNRVSDFVFREPFNDYLLVELEAPCREIFRIDGQQREELTHAINQTSEWVEYIANNRQKVEKELELVGISANPRCLVVIGSSESLSEENRHRLVTLQAQQPRLRILTYDDLIASARANLERLFGPLRIVAENAELYFFK